MDNGNDVEVLNISDSEIDKKSIDGFGALRCTFHIEKTGLHAINYADISIYNLTGSTEKAIIEEGMQVIVNAGYEDGAYGTILRVRSSSLSGIRRIMLIKF